MSLAPMVPAPTTHSLPVGTPTRDVLAALDVSSLPLRIQVIAIRTHHHLRQVETAICELLDAGYIESGLSQMGYGIHVYTPTTDGRAALRA